MKLAGFLFDIIRVFAYIPAGFLLFISFRRFLWTG